MGVTVGTRLGHYEIRSALGAGGMGEVYRAHDTRLGRDVAIKVLPPAFISDGDRLARFEREARVLASLNHPHIAGIFGIEESGDGASGPPTKALVLELVEGETLADRLASGVRGSAAIRLPEALAIARQIVDALDAAHEKGVVHRDLKPGNIMITSEGVVKVLDFGLAKAGDTGPRPDLTHSPTLTMEATRRGVLLGTAAYMSPEQARGHGTDKRTDIWAFGCVLYEMLTGRPVFRGETVTDVLAAVIEREPDWSALPASTPESIGRLVRRCLRKSTRERLRDIADVGGIIDEAADDTGQGATPSHDQDGVRGVRAVWVTTATLLALVAGVVAGVSWSRVRSSDAPSASALEPMSRLTSDAGLSTEPSLSDDGRLVAYASNRAGAGDLDIYVQQAAGGSAIRLTDDPANDREPDISPDGSLVAFHSDRAPRGVYVAAALGGSARLVAANGFAPKFSPDGRSIAFWTGNWLASRSIGLPQRTYVVPAAGGTPRQVATNIASAGHAVWSPDGGSLLVFGRETTSGPGTDPDWWWVSSENGTAVRTGAYSRFMQAGIRINQVRTMPYPQAWTERGVFFSGESGNGDTRSLWVVPIDERSGQVTGDPVRLTNGSTTDASVDVSPSGHVALSAQSVARVTFALPIDERTGRPSGPMRRLRQDNTPTGRVSVAESGLLAVVPIIERAASGIWLRDLTTGLERQLVVTPRTPLNPVISADGRWIAYTVTTVDTGGDSGPGEGFIVSADGGVPRKVCDACIIENWRRDNRVVVMRQPGQTTLVRLDVTSGERVPLVVGDAGDFDRPMFGPGGRWFSFNLNRDSFVAPVHPDRAVTASEWIRAFERSPEGTAERTAGLSPDGGLLYVLLERDGFRCLYAVPLDAQTGRPRGAPFPVSHFHDATKQWGSTGMGSAVTRGAFFADLFDTSGNIWLTALAGVTTHD